MVQDDHGCRQRYRLALANAGFAVSCVSSTTAARKWIKQNAVDLLIVDMGLDNGEYCMALAERLRTVNSSLSVLLISSDSLPCLFAAGTIEPEAFISRQTGFLRKPVPEATLMGMVGALLDRGKVRVSLMAGPPPEPKPLARTARA